MALSSGTAALHLALLVSGVQPGDDVLVSSLTFAATANAVVHCGANPVFVDSERTSWNMDPALLADALAAARRRGRLPAAAVVVDLYGQCADYDAIVTLCRDHGVVLVEDAAEALGATPWRPCRRDPRGHRRVLVQRQQGRHDERRGSARHPRRRYRRPCAPPGDSGREPAAHFEHVEVGFNYRLSNLLAAIGRAQLARLSGMIDRRLAIHAAIGRPRRCAGLGADAARVLGALERVADVHRCR